MAINLEYLTLLKWDIIPFEANLFNCVRVCVIKSLFCF